VSLKINIAMISK